tara:strand:+ start:299 stop:532 length:234 start_codon:yes stop_codon:yes gene_type:complete
MRIITTKRDRTKFLDLFLINAAPNGAPKITIGTLTHHIDHVSGAGPPRPIFMRNPNSELTAIKIIEVKVTFFGSRLK